MENQSTMHRTDIGQLQRLHDAIAITLDAIRRITTNTAPDYRTTSGPWIPAPPVDTGLAASRPRFEHSGWQPSWPAPFAQPAPWQDWSQSVLNRTWTEPTRAWHEPQPPTWPVVSYWGPFRPF